jgi:hypothetical protein
VAKFLSDSPSKTTSKSDGKKLLPSRKDQLSRAVGSAGPRKTIAKRAPESRAALDSASPQTGRQMALKPLRGMDAVRKVLEALHMELYSVAFEETGYDDIDFLTSLDEPSLGAVAELVGMKPGHAARFKAWLNREAMTVLGESSQARERA